MFKKSASIVAGVLLLASPLAVSALQPLETNDMIIKRLQAQIASLLARIQELQVKPSTSCVTISQNLTLGSTGSDVTSLQNYLIQKGHLLNTTATGYYGFMTAQAVGKLQMSLGTLSSQEDSSYGLFGPRTREAVRCGNTSDDNTKTCRIDVPEGANIRMSDQSTSNACKSFCDVYGSKDATSNGGVAVCKFKDTLIASYGWESSHRGNPPKCTFTPRSTGRAGEIGFSQNMPETAETCKYYCIGSRNERWGYTDAGSCVYTYTDGGQSVMSIEAGMTATIDQSSLADLATNPTFTGSAKGVTHVTISVIQVSTNLELIRKLVPVSVINERWSLRAGGEAPRGSYTVRVLDMSNPDRQFASATYTAGIATATTATIDQSSLTSNTGNPTITGTASGMTGVVLRFVNRAGVAYGDSSREAPVVNGRWTLTATLGLPTGTYTVSVYPNESAGAAYSGTILTSGTLTVGSVQPTISDFIVGDVRAEGSAIAGQPLRLKVTYRDVNGVVRAGTSAKLTVEQQAVSYTGIYTDAASAYFTGAYADVAYITVLTDKVIGGLLNAVVTINKDGAVAESDRTNNTLTVAIPVQPNQDPFVTVIKDNSHYFVSYAYLKPGMHIRLIGVDASAVALPVRTTTRESFTGSYTNSGVWSRTVPSNGSENIDLSTTGVSIPAGTYVLEVSDPIQSHIIVLRTLPFAISAQ